MNVSVIGLGYVGAVTAACLARDGHDDPGIDLGPNKLRRLRDGKAPIIEEEIEEITREAADSGRLAVTGKVDATIATCDLILDCVGTKSAANDSHVSGALAGFGPSGLG